MRTAAYSLVVMLNASTETKLLILQIDRRSPVFVRSSMSPEKDGSSGAELQNKNYEEGNEEGSRTES